MKTVIYVLGKKYMLNENIINKSMMYSLMIQSHGRKELIDLNVCIEEQICIMQETITKI